MTNRLLVDVEGLRDLEMKKQWLEACVLLYDNWRSAPDNVDKLNRAALECWYVYIEAPVIGCREDPGTLAQLQHMLLECAQYGLTRFGDQFSFLWAFGYMLSVSPIPFDSGPESTEDSTGSYLHWESVGVELRARGLRLFASHPLSQVAFKNHIDMDSYQAEIATIADILDDYFPGDSELEQYFREIYHV